MTTAKNQPKENVPKTYQRRRGEKARGRSQIYLRGEHWWINFQDNKGSRQRYSLKTRDRREAEGLQKAKEQELLAGRLQVRRKVGVTTFTSEFFQSLAQNNRRPRTLITYDWAINKFLSLCAHAYLKEYTSDDIDSFKGAMLAEGLTAASVNCALRHVRAFFSRAVEQKYLHETPFPPHAMLKVPRRIPKYAKKEEVQALLEVMKAHPPFDLVVALGALCGFRRGEICGSLWEWFDWKAKTVTLSSRQGFKLKDYEARTVPLSPWAIQVIRPQAKKAGYCIVLPRVIKKRNETIHTTYPRESPELYLDKHFRRIRPKGLEHVTLKMLRSSFGSMLLQAGVPLSKISLWMGHSSEKVTRDHYATLMAYDSDIEKLKED